jgi:type IV pilus assembly protein PilV
VRLTDSRPRQAGFTLAEVLVALVVFAFGMLGVAGLQVKALTGLDIAQNRSLATLKAGELADRIRANPGAAYPGATAADKACRAAHYHDKHAVPDDCSAEELAADDLEDWRRELAGRLPSGTGLVCVDSTPDDGSASAPACDGIGSALAIKVWWRERLRSASDSADRRQTLSLVNP